jgi:hypothetical protein
MSMVCCSFAVFQILAWRRVFPDERTAITDWGIASLGCIAVYFAGMLIRWSVFRHHLKQSGARAEGGPSDAASRPVQP